MLNSNTLKVRILKEIDKSKNGLSAWDLEKRIGRSNTTFQAIQRHLNRFEDIGLIKKVGSKYKISTPMVIVNGTIISADPLMIMNCPYFGRQCDCSGKLKSDCRYINELPKQLSSFLKELLKQ